MMNRHAIVLHGLALNRWWMAGVSWYLRRAGYTVHSISYPSRRKDCHTLVEEYLAPLVEKIPADKVDFVVHSMGGILTRIYAEKYGAERIGRVVMLGTPNQGSEVADFLKPWRIFRRYFGRAGMELVTSEEGITRRLHPVTFACGVIAGTNHWFHFPTSSLVKMPRPNDGIVSVESTKVEGMKDHVSLFLDHSLMVWTPRVWKLTLRFLQSGRFQG